MKSKTAAALLICAVMCAAFCSCGQGAESSRQEYYQIVTDPPTEPEETEPNGAEDYVKTAREETFEYTARNGESEKARFAIPKIDIDSAAAREINKEIEKTYDGDFTGSAEKSRDGASLEVRSIDYEAYLNDDIISIVITRTAASHSVTYGVYNYDVSNNKTLDNKSLSEATGREYDEVMSELQNSLQNDYLSKFKYNNFPDDYYISLENTLSDENLEASQLFLDGSARLYAICKEFASVGQGEFTVRIRVDY